MPDWTELLRPRLQRLDLRAEREAEIAEELAQHLDERYADLLAAGTPETEARRQAVQELIDPDTLVGDLLPLRQARVPPAPEVGVRSGSLLVDLWQDLRYTFRSWHKQIGFVLVAVWTLALGIGANSAIFALVDATLLKPLPLPAPEQLLGVWESTANNPRGRVSPNNLRDWSMRSGSFEGIAGYVDGVGGMVMAGKDGTAQTVPRQWVTAGIFDVLGIQPLAGRSFSAVDDQAQVNAVVLSESFWRERFDAAPGVIGSSLRLDGDLYAVVGVVPDHAQLLGHAQIWALMSLADLPPEDRGARFLRTVARLKPGVSMAQGSAELRHVAAALATEHPSTNAGRSVQIDALHDVLMGSDLKLTSLLFLGVVGFVLLICCANVANLLLARASVRSRELAIRVALGAQRGRLARMVLTECLLLALLGGLLGLALGAAIIAATPKLLPPGLLPGTLALVFDLRLLVFCALTTLLVGLLFGLAPAWQALRVAPAQTIGMETRGSTHRGGKMRGLLVTIEVATAVVLLFGAGLLLRTVLSLQNVDRGYRENGVLTMLVDPLGERYPTDAELLRFFDGIEREVRSVHDVATVAWASGLPLGQPGGNAQVAVVGAPPVEPGMRPVADLEVVSPGYFETLDIPLLAGRSFSADDRADSTPVAVISEAFARQHFGTESALGRRIEVRTSSASDAPATIHEIVGVVRQIVARSHDDRAAPAQLYLPLAQAALDDVYLIVRAATGSAEALTNPVRQAVARLDPEQLVSVREVLTLADITRQATARHRFRAVLVVSFAGLALLLAMVGVFGILAWSVQQRRRDFGVRMALGASPRDVLRLVLGGAARMIGMGAGIGLLLSLLLGQFLATLLVGVQPVDPITLLAVTAVIVIAAIVCSAAPAWRAARVDGLVALRGD